MNYNFISHGQNIIHWITDPLTATLKLMATKERKTEAAMKVAAAIESLKTALREEKKILEFSSTKKNRPLKRIRNMATMIPVLKYQTAKRLAYYGSKKKADAVAPGHESFK